MRLVLGVGVVLRHLLEAFCDNKQIQGHPASACSAAVAGMALPSGLKVLVGGLKQLVQPFNDLINACRCVEQNVKDFVPNKLR